MREAKSRRNYVIDPTDYALVIKADGEVRLYIPAHAPSEGETPKQALALLVVANKLCDDEWVSSLLDEDYFEDATLMGDHSQP